MTEDEYEYFEAAVIGSGFGGSIAAIELAKVFKDLNDQNPGDPEKRVLILERGIWYMSPEASIDPSNHVTNFIKKNKKPYRFWVMPDNSKASLNLLAMLWTFPLGKSILGRIGDFFLRLTGKKINPNGLYDIKNFNESFALVASGVGGGSLVYSNVTIAPEPEIIDEIYYEEDRGNAGGNAGSIWKPRWAIRYSDLERYMMYAKYKFIEVSKIYSVQAGYYDEQMLLPKTKELHDAVKNLKQHEYEAEFELVDLSITEAPSWDPKTNQYEKGSTKFCRRQGRCNFGCLPGARHSLNKKLVDAIEAGLPIDIREHAEASVIEPITGGRDGYLVYYKNPGNGERHRIIRAKTLILAAGTFGTTGLILRSKEHYNGDPLRKENLNVSESVGTSFSLNGDYFGFVIDTKNPVYITRGPIDTAHVRFKKKGKHYFTIEDATIPRIVAGTFAAAIQRYLERENEDLQKARAEIWESTARLAEYKWDVFKHHLNHGFLVLWAFHPVIGFAYEYMWRANSDVLKFIGAIIKRLFDAWPKREWGESQYGSQNWLPGTKEHDDLPHNHQHRILDDLEVDYLLSRVFFFACMGIDSANGKAKWDPDRKRLDVNWDGLAKDPIYKDIQRGMEMLGNVMVNTNKKTGNKEKYLILDPMKQLFDQEYGDSKNGEKASKMFALHPLGGCPMETEGRRGAVDIFGRLLKNNHTCYENLYVADGSIVPTALGVNPSLTISALAFGIVDSVTKSYRREGPILNSVKENIVYDVTFMEISKCGERTCTVATVDPTYYIGADAQKKKMVYDNIVYVDGYHLPKGTYRGGLACKGKVDIMKVNGRFAEGKLVSQVQVIQLSR